jgi:fatty acid desaturase
LSGIPTWIGHAKTLVNNAAGRCSADFLPKPSEGRIIRESRFLLIGYAGILTITIVNQSDALFWVWLLPALLGQPFLRLYLLAEHGLCPRVANMFENTRTTFTNSVVRFLAWNMPYHTEHHVYPTVPFHKLPQLHDLMKTHLVNTENGYAAFSASYIEDLTAHD